MKITGSRWLWMHLLNFSGANAHAWDKNKLKAKLKSWRDTYKGYTCTQSPISDYCKKGICKKKESLVCCVDLRAAINPY